MIVNFINTLKDISVFKAIQKTKTEMAFVADNLNNFDFDVTTDYRKELILSGDCKELRNYYEDLEWLESLLNKTPIVNVDKIDFHDKLKDALIVSKLI
jgi:hypothetical protein